GTATLSGTNTYTGGTTISAGTLIANEANLGAASGGLVMAGGTLAPPAAMSSSRDLTVAAGGGTFDATSGSITLGGTGNTTWQAGNLAVTGGTLQFNRSG